jgi:GTP-binding protein EngB required for normal cell division
VAELTPAQQSHFRASLARIDRLLCDALQFLAASETDVYLRGYAADATPVQRKVVADYAAALRGDMEKALERLRVPRFPVRTGTVRAARTAILYAHVALEGIEPQAMRGYGALDNDTERELRAVSAQLMEDLKDIDACLAQGPGRDIRERLHRLASESLDGRALSGLERVITAQALTELRPMLDMLAERLEAPQLEVAVFGRTSAGKSSLINRLLGTAALPVGVAPVTAVPLRIVHGPKAWGRAWFADAIPESFPLGRLAEFVDGHYNAANARHVTRITLELPASILQDGIALVDTPGVGSLATASATEARAYLPRCDIGIVLVDAATSLTHEDVALVDALHRAGASIMVLLAKADLLSREDRLRSVAYLRRELEARTAVMPPIHCVSVVGREAGLCDGWRDQVLLPLLQAKKSGLQLSLRRKIGVLRQATLAALERRLRSSGPAERPAQIRSALDHALASLDMRASERVVLFADAARAANEILDEVAHNTAVVWSKATQREIDVATLLAASCSGRVRAAANELSRELVSLRAMLAASLDEAARAVGEPREIEALPAITGMPIFAEAAAEPLLLSRPSLAVGLRLRRAVARRRLRRLRGPMLRAMAEYEDRLNRWRGDLLGELRRSFLAQRTLLEADYTSPATSATTTATRT